MNNPLLQDILSQQLGGVDELLSLIVTSDLHRQLLFQRQQQDIVDLVEFDQETTLSHVEAFIGDTTIDAFLEIHQLTYPQLVRRATLQPALSTFAIHLFSSVAEEIFLSRDGSHDQLIYSMTRVNSPGLAHELWLRVEDRESNLHTIASEYGQGPEALRSGIIGPQRVCDIFPIELRSAISSLQPGQVLPPMQLGSWFVLVRLEHREALRFDESTKRQLILEELDKLLQSRVTALLQGESIEPLAFT